MPYVTTMEEVSSKWDVMRTLPKVLVAHRKGTTAHSNTHTHRDTQRHTETHRDTQRHRHTNERTHAHAHTNTLD